MTTHLTVTGTELLTPNLRRVWFRSDDLSAFAGSNETDRYLKLVFLKPGVTYPEPLDVRALRGVLPPEDLPSIRTYTALFPDVEAGTVAIDFVVHGDEGVAGPWAASAVAGDTLLANGPGGGYAPDPAADWHLLIGDESAVPAITAALVALPGDAVVRAFVLVDSPDHEPDLPLPEDGTVTFRYRSAGATGLEAAVRSLEWLPGTVQVFAHGEAADIMHGIWPYLLTELGLPRDQVSISGYWRLGAEDEAWRAQKRQWNEQIEAAETAAGLH